MTQAPDRDKALELAMAQIEKAHGKGSYQRIKPCPQTEQGPSKGSMCHTHTNERHVH